MRIKNISSVTIKLPEFDLALKPGDETDLSKFDPALVSNHPTLTSYFQKGLLINLGFAKTLGSKQRLNSAKARIEKLNLKDDFVVKNKDSSFDKKKEIKKAERKDVLKNSSLRAEIERYKAEHLQNSDPLNFNFEDLEKPKPRPKIEKSVPAMMVGINGSLHSEKSLEIPPGTIYPRELVGETTFLAIETSSQPKKTVKDSEIIINLNDRELKVDLDRIRERSESLCTGTQINGTGCKRRKVRGFEVCFHHMTELEKQEYQQSKKSRSEDN